MTEIIITSSILIFIVLALRFLLRGKLSPTVIYALWAIVALRLLLPFSLIDSRVSVMNLFERQETIDEPIDIEQTFQSVPDYMLNGDNHYADTDELHEELPYAEYEIIQNEQNGSADNTHVDNGVTKKNSTETKDILLAVWLTGAVGVLGYALFSNLTFWLRLKNSREQLYENTLLPVYIAEGISTPCLFGVIRPGIYLNEFAAGDRQRAEYIINHEYIHYAHRDHIWAIVRVLCVSVYWFNPLVWIAASVSRQDSELACDRAVVKAIGEEHRLDYGRTLVDMMGVHYAPANVTLTVTSMNSGAKSIKERISTICRNPQTLLWSAITVCVVIVAAFVVTFTGASRTGSEEFASATDTPSASDVPSSADAEPTYRPFHLYPSMEIRLFEQNSEECTGFAAVSALDDLDYIMNVLLEAEQNIVTSREMDNSWIAAEICVDLHTYYNITNDGYIIMSYDGASVAFSEPVTVEADNVAGGTYYEGHFGFFKIPDDMIGPFHERLSSICQEHQIRIPGGVGVSTSPKEKLNVLLYDGVDNRNPVQRYIFDGSEQYHVINWLMRTEEWEEVGLEAIPDSKILAHIYYDNDFSDHFYFMSDGYVIWKYLGTDVKTDRFVYDYANEYANGTYREGYVGGYKMPKDTLDTMLTVIGEITAAASEEYPELAAAKEQLYEMIKSGTCRLEYPNRAFTLDTVDEVEGIINQLTTCYINTMMPFDPNEILGDNRVIEECSFVQTDPSSDTFGVSATIKLSQYAAWITIEDGDMSCDLKLSNYEKVKWFFEEGIKHWHDYESFYNTGNFPLDALFSRDLMIESEYYDCGNTVERSDGGLMSIWELLNKTVDWKQAVEQPVLDETDSKIMTIRSTGAYNPPDCRMTIFAESGYIRISLKNEGREEVWYRVPEGLDELCYEISLMLK